MTILSEGVRIIAKVIESEAYEMIEKYPKKTFTIDQVAILYLSIANSLNRILTEEE